MQRHNFTEPCTIWHVKLELYYVSIEDEGASDLETNISIKYQVLQLNWSSSTFLTPGRTVTPDEGDCVLNTAKNHNSHMSVVCIMVCKTSEKVIPWSQSNLEISSTVWTAFCWRCSESNRRKTLLRGKNKNCEEWKVFFCLFWVFLFFIFCNKAPIELVFS